MSTIKTIAFVLCILLGAPHVQAHPHQFIDYNVSFNIEGTLLTSVDVHWYVDEMISAWIIGDFNLVPDIEYTGDEYIKYAGEVFYELQKLYYYVIASYKNKPILPQRWQNTKMVVTKDGLLHFSFTLPFNVTLTPGPETVRFLFDDETYYVGFSLKPGKIMVKGTGASAAVITTETDDYAQTIIIRLAK